MTELLLLVMAVFVVLAVLAHLRNNWVFDRMNELNRFENDVHVIRNYADYNTMMLRFWVWDIEKFKTPNAGVTGAEPKAERPR